MSAKASSGEEQKQAVKLKPVSSKLVSQDEDTKNKFPVLKSTKRDIAPLDRPTTELSKIKLKKAGGWKVFGC